MVTKYTSFRLRKGCCNFEEPGGYEVTFCVQFEVTDKHLNRQIETSNSGRHDSKIGKKRLRAKTGHDVY